VTVTLGTGALEVHDDHAEAGWRVTLADTGEERRGTGGRLGRVLRYLGRERFMVTYGDGVADIDIDRLVAFTSRTASWPPSPRCGPPRASARW
jgi:glucose-1-phosphate cytidylyltransferase